MHLLHTTELKLSEFVGSSVPLYAILSHTWDKEEVLYDHVQRGVVAHLAGYKKLKGACDVAAADGWEWIWVDTCCINKQSSAELSEAINSMYSWYQQAEVCFVYLNDLRTPCDPNDNISFESCRWFRRGES